MEITGRVTADATIATLPDERRVVNFTVAVNDRYRTKSGEQRDNTVFFRCAYWISTGIAKVLRKGTLVSLYGKVSADAYMAGDEPRANLRFHTSDIQLLGSPKQPAADTAPQRESTREDGEDLPF